ncbi:MAG: aldo/keto reductase family oxidoreductase [Acidimicrobiales bacterium]|nr:aldo/keto reductase family oxidoreductase [Acidimicrobiales bacterium]
MPEVGLPSGAVVPILGQGTWRMGDDPRRRDEEIAALRLGLDLGMTLIDTAEMYGNGASERLVGEAIEGQRDDVFLVTKVLPHHATPAGMFDACRASLRRLGVDHVELYLLHWRGPTPLAETVQGFADLLDAGLIRHWGVSNFDADDLAELINLPGGGQVATDQVLYNLSRRGIEHDLLPACQAAGLPVMAYSPIEQGRLLGHPALRAVADAHRATPGQVALAWVLRHDADGRGGVIAIPKASTEDHVRENRGAVDIHLTPDDLARLDQAFPPPRGPVPLSII